MNNKLPLIKNLVLNKDKPVSLIHFVTNKCNARCPHCFIDFDNKVEQNTKLTLEDVDKLTRNIGPELMNVNITGGEPFYAKDLEEICELYIKNTNIESIFFSTHGGPVKQIEKFLKFAEKHKNITFIFSISIDHIGEKHSEYRKVKGLFEKAIETYNNLKNGPENIRVVASITVSEFNCFDMNTIFDELVGTYNIDEITANIVRDEGVYKIADEAKKNIHTAYVNLISKIKSYEFSKRKNKKSNLKTKLFGSVMNYKDDFMHEGIAQTFLNPKLVLPCYAGGGLLGVIYTNGDVFPCEVLDKKMGNLYDYDFDIKKMWKDYEKTRKWILDSKCNCTYECAWSYNVVASPSHYPKMLKKIINDI